MAKSDFHAGISSSGDVINSIASFVEASGFSIASKTDTQCKLGAFTVNNLPVLLQADYDSFQDQVSVIYKFAVPPLKDLTTESIKFILTHGQAAATASDSLF